MSDWQTVTLGALCSKVTSGGTPLRSVPEYYEGGTIPWLKTGEVKKDYIWATEEHITARGLEASSAKLIPANSLIVAMYGDGNTAGNVAINKVPLATNQACCNFVLNPAIADYRFVYHYLKGSYNNLVGLKVGGSQQNLNAATLKSFPVNLPSLPVQKKIGAILSAYDELIANNQRRITLLERMAEDIYREWFVRLRFPGHAKASIEKGMPKGWRFAELSEMATINRSSIAKTSRLDRILYIDISAVSTNHIDDLTEMALSEAPGRARRLVKHGDVIWSSVRPANRAYCLIYEPPENLVASTGFAVISPKDGIPFTFINFAVTSDSFVEQMAMVAKGSAYPATSFDDFGKAKVLFPPPDLCEPMFRRREQLRRANAALSRQRDALLPRLISGKLSVDGLDIRFPPDM